MSARDNPVGRVVLLMVVAFLAVKLVGYAMDYRAYHNPADGSWVFRFKADDCRAVFGAELTDGTCRVRARGAFRPKLFGGRSELVVFMPDGREITIPNASRDLHSWEPAGK